MQNDKTEVPHYTAHDVVLSTIYLPILIRAAKDKQTITYGALVEGAKELHPDNEYVKRSIPVLVGRRLNVLRQILRENSLPDLSSLIVSTSSSDAVHLQAKTERKRVYDTDWDSHASIIDSNWVKYPYDEVEFAEIKERDPEPKAPSREELKRINWDYWQENKELYPKWFRSKNEEVMSLLLQGYPVADCYKRVLDRGETQGSKDIKPKKNAKKLKKFRRRV